MSEILSVFLERTLDKTLFFVYNYGKEKRIQQGDNMRDSAGQEGVYRSKALRLSGRMLQDIRSGCFRNRELLPSELELSRHYGVSRTTIRRVISILISSGELVKEPNRTARISDLSTHSRPSPGAGEEEDGAFSSPFSIAFVYAGVPDGFVVGTSEGTKEFCREHGCDLQFFTSEQGHDEVIDLLNHASELGIDGLIVLPYETEAYRNAICGLLERNFPIVCLDRPLGGMKLNSVEVDNSGGVCLAASALITRFSRPVYYLGAVPNHSTQQNRLNGFRMAMREAGYSDRIHDYLLLYPATDNDPEYWEETKMQEPPYRKVKSFLSGASLPVSILCMNDYVALAVYRAAEELGLSIGSDVMVCGFDDLPLARLQSPPLSSIEQPRRRIGFEAADLLCKLISGKIGRSVNLRLPVELHERESTLGRS